MTVARSRLVDIAVTRWYHCVTRCVRRAFLLGEGPLNRKEWIESRVKELSEIFAVPVGGFSVLDNHFSRSASRALRFSMKNHCWRRVRTLI